MLDEKGVTLVDYAKSKNVPYEMAVLLINGHLKGKRGKAHNAAIRLGLKHGELVAERGAA